MNTNRVNGTQLKTKSVGMTLSHFEFDLDLLNDAGDINYFPVATVGKTIREVMTAFNVLRFMNWQKTNVNPIWKMGGNREFHAPPANLWEFNDWEDRDEWRRPPEGRASWRGKWSEARGVPLKYCLHVAKTTHSHPWICIPHSESKPQFTTLMQHIVETTLDALKDTGLTPIFEYSNEVWNGGRFEQQAEIANIHMKGWIGEGQIRLPKEIWDKIARNEPLSQLEAQDKKEHDTAARLNRPAAFKQQILCTNELKAYVGERGLVVIGAQCNDPSVAEALLFNAEVPLSAEVDALAIAPYYGPVRQVQEGWTSLKKIFPKGFHPLIDLKDGSIIDPDAPDALQRLYENLHAYICGTTDVDDKKVGGETHRAFKDHRELVDLFNQERDPANKLQLFTYEGGLDLRYQAAHFKERQDGRLRLSADFANAMTQEKVADLYYRFHHDRRAGKLVDDVFELWHSADVRGDLFVGYSSATQYQRAGNKLNGDFFGHIDLQDVPGIKNDDRYVGTHKLKQLLERAQ